MEQSLTAAKNCFKDDLWEWFGKVNDHRARINLPPLEEVLDRIVALFGRDKLLSEYDRMISDFLAAEFDADQAMDGFNVA